MTSNNLRCHRYVRFCGLVFFASGVFLLAESDRALGDQKIKEQLLNACAAQTGVTANISFEFDIRAFSGSSYDSWRLSYEEKGYYHMAEAGKRSIRRASRLMNSKDAAEQTIQRLIAVDADCLAIQNFEDCTLNSWLNKTYTENDVLATSIFSPLFGVILIMDTNDNEKSLTFSDLITNADILSEDDGKLVHTQTKIGKFTVKMCFDATRNSAIKTIHIESSGASRGAELLSHKTEVTEYELVESVYLPKIVRIQEHFSSGEVTIRENEVVDTPVTYDKYEYSLTNYRANNTANDFNLLNIPNGTRVRMEDAPQIAYIWLNGKIEPKTDEVMLKIAQGDHKFIPGADEPRFWIMALGAILIIVGFTFKGIELYKKWHEDDDKKEDDKKEESKKENEEKQEGETP
ncbi:hypothetical protein FACS189419_07380 [Planctomycetales bacterium]|nr:hypothetical protein FACS189419_07380 [Planctomycetales bacterium]